MAAQASRQVANQGDFFRPNGLSQKRLTRSRRLAGSLKGPGLKHAFSALGFLPRTTAIARETYLATTHFRTR